ncbi:MAG: flagellar hook basal-body protein [Planctomycetota bacterium]
MKPLRFAVPALAAILVPAALTGCTVHHHYYGNTGPASPGAIAAAADPPGQAILADQLAGVHTAIEVTATNLANTNAIGYKARRVTFVEGQPQPNITIDWSPGSPEITDRPLDLYIEGDGFFQVDIEEEHGGGVAYTRRGQFFVNADGDLVLGNADGPRLADGINIPGDVMSITISAGGKVDVIHPDNSTSSVGMITLHTFVCPDGLEPLGNGLYVETERSGPSTQDAPGQGRCGRLAQGMLENSNVRPIMEMIELKKLGRWADAISEEIGLTAYQRLAFQDPSGTLQTARNATNALDSYPTQADFEKLIQDQAQRDNERSPLQYGLQIQLNPTQPDFDALLQAELDTMSSHDR